MPGGGSKPGERRGGRQKGSLNKKTLARLTDRRGQIAAIEASKAEDPLDHLLQSMRDPTRTPQDRDYAATAALPYLKPKLSAVDLRAETKAQYWISDRPLTSEEWALEFTGPTIAAEPRVPVAHTIEHVHRIEVDLRDKKIAQLEEQIEKLRDALTLREAEEAARKALP